MPLAVWNGRTIFFAHVPKTGGSTVEDYLIQRFGPLSILDRNKRENTPGTGLMMPATHLASIDLAELLPETLDYSFTMVRDPVGRLQSEYRYQMGVSRTTRFSFATWLRVMLACLRMEPRIYQNHIRPQSDLVPEGAEVFHLERGGMEAMIQRLDEVTGETAPDLAIRHLLKRKHEPITLYRQDAELIENHLAADYERFGFERRDRAELPVDRYALPREAFARMIAPAIVWRQRLRWIR